MAKTNHFASPFRRFRAALRIILCPFCFGCQATGKMQSIREDPPAIVRGRHLAYGIPGTADYLIQREGYALGFSIPHKQAVWVSYELTADDLVEPRATRTNRFRKDPDIPECATSEDYTRSGFDRGHLAAAADMTRSASVMAESFYMSNISPQRPRFNRGIWLALEKQVRHFAKTERRIIIVTGPILPSGAAANQTIGQSKVSVPEYFYKVIYDTTPPEKMLAFIIPNRSGSANLRTFVVTVDQVEQLTGLDFFSSLPTEMQDVLEKKLSTPQWKWLE